MTDTGETSAVREAISASRGKCALMLVQPVEAHDRDDSGVGARLQRMLASMLRDDDHIIYCEAGVISVILDQLIDIHHAELAALKFLRLINASSESVDAACGIAYLGRLPMVLPATDSHLEYVNLAHQALENASAHADGPRYEILSPECHSSEDWQIGSRLQEAMQAHQITLDFQPKLQLGSGDIVGAEAIVRWREDGTVLAPADYLPALTSSQLWELSAYVLRKMIQCIEQTAPTFSIATKIESTLLLNPELRAFLRRETSLWSVDPAKVTLEFSADSDLLNQQSCLDALTQLKDDGFRICVHDIQITHETMLERLCCDEIKLNPTLVGELRPSHSAEVQQLFARARRSAITTAAEGIESAATRDNLRNWGCSVGQGFFLASPVPAQAFSTLLHGRSQQVSL